MSGDGSELMPALPGETPDLPAAAGIDADIAEWDAEDPDDRENPFEVSVSGEEVLVDDMWHGDTFVYRMFKSEAAAEKSAEALEAALDRIIATKLTFAEIRARLEDWEEGIALNASQAVRARRKTELAAEPENRKAIHLKLLTDGATNSLLVKHELTGKIVATTAFPSNVDVRAIARELAPLVAPAVEAGADAEQVAKLWRDAFAAVLKRERRKVAHDYPDLPVRPGAGGGNDGALWAAGAVVAVVVLVLLAAVFSGGH